MSTKLTSPERRMAMYPNLALYAAISLVISVAVSHAHPRLPSAGRDACPAAGRARGSRVHLHHLVHGPRRGPSFRWGRLRAGRRGGTGPGGARPLGRARHPPRGRRTRPVAASWRVVTLRTGPGEVRHWPVGVATAQATMRV